MKYLLPALVCLFIGYQIGNWLPKRELHLRQVEVKDLKEEIRRGAAGGSSGIGLGNIFPMDAPPSGDSRTVVQTNIVTEVETITNEVNVVVTQQVEVAQVSTNQVKESRRERRERWEAMGSEERMDELLELWEMRSALAKDAFFANVELSEDQKGAFEAAIQGMNMQLETGIKEWAEQVRTKGSTGVQDGIRLMNLMTGSVVQGYDFMDKRMPDGWEADAGKDFQVLDFVSPTVAKPIFDLEEDGFDMEGFQPRDRWEDEVEEQRGRRGMRRDR